MTKKPLPPRGFNPLRHDCRYDGCFNTTIRARVEQFSECFPRAIGFTDIDYMVEIGGHILIQEFKQPGELLKTGQRLALERMTGPCTRCGHVGRVTVFVVTADRLAEKVHGFTPIYGGRTHPTREADLEELKTRLRTFANWADSTPF